MRAAWIYWQQGRLENLVERLTRATSLAGSLPQNETLLLAETLFQLQRNREAAPLFNRLRSDPDFGAQASYRSAQLLLRQGENLPALNLLLEFVDKDRSSPWSILAQDLLKELNVTNF
jgi:thioredoxin-like negative regulator of GroEL